MSRALQIAGVLWMCCVSPGMATPDLWQALRDGSALALIRHAEAPGTGDPPGFRLDDCASQRNLSAEGRAQAARLGERFRSNGIAAAEMHSSQWCRSRDTAQAMALGGVQDAPALNSQFGRAAEAAAGNDAMRRLIAALPPGRPAVLVSHQVNITGLTGIYPRSGEVVVIRRSDLAVLGRLVPE